uniref:Endonuclease/exonuclease/phosphatase domain-containing protein n=1 Tax=Octopus bimaculoides TaxID=37653 RepID=A0A0L8HXY7_OCTBM
MMQAGESLQEASVPTTLLMTKTKTRIGTWNIQTLYEAGKTRWTGTGCTRLTRSNTIIYSGQEGQPHTYRVALLMTSEEPVSPKILTARLNSKGRKVNILQCYAPINATIIKKNKEEFYEQLQVIMDKTPERDPKILMGDLSAKVGTDNKGRGQLMGRHGIRRQNENGELVIGGTIFPHKKIHKTTGISPDGKTENQIDYIIINRKWRRSLQDFRVKRRADTALDHYLVVAVLRTRQEEYHTGTTYTA